VATISLSAIAPKCCYVAPPGTLSEDLRNFEVGLLDWAETREPVLLETALSVAPELVSVRFGDQWSIESGAQG